MPKIAYEHINFREKTLTTIQQALEIINEYEAEGYVLTLRQLYYQFVARALLPNTENSYDNLGSVINRARLAGYIDWKSIEDRTRKLEKIDHWDSPSEIVEACADQFKIDRWANQQYRPELWIEKEALVGITEKICKKYDVPYLACRGYVSQSEQWKSGQRLADHIENGQTPFIFHLGDHDPSGIDMSRDNRERLCTFAESSDFEFERLALNMDQVDHYNPPPNPTKITDSRAPDYITKFGYKSWELDALEPKVLVALVEDSITSLLDDDAWEESRQEQRKGRIALRKASKVLLTMEQEEMEEIDGT